MLRPPPSSSTGWHQVFNVLAASCLVSGLTGVAVTHYLVGSYREGLDVAGVWSERAARLQQLAVAAARANAPGNDVFESRAVAEEERRFEELERAFDETDRMVRDELRRGDDPEVSDLHEPLEAAERSFRTMSRETRTIFRAFRRDDAAEAGRHMASMDRALAETHAAIARAAATTRERQRAALDGQLRRAERTQHLEWALLALVALMVSVLVIYGTKLARIFQRANTEIARRNQAFTRVLENIDEGLVSVALDGTVGSERSPALERLVGPVEASDRLWSWLTRHDPKAAAMVETVWPELSSNDAPTEMWLALLPRTLRCGERQLRLAFRPMIEAGRLEGVLLVVTDVSHELAKEAALADQRELVALFDFATSDAAGLRSMVEELEGHVAAATGSASSLSEVRRAVHTVKGNAAFLGALRLAALCHRLEESMVERREGLSVDERAELDAEMAGVRVRAEKLLGARADNEVVVRRPEIERFVRELEQRGVPQELVRHVTRWGWESIHARFARLADLARSIAIRQGKQVEVHFASGDLRVPRELAALWGVLPHLIRNAVAHGLESPDDRTAVGKRPVGQVKLEARTTGRELHIVVQDDGPGLRRATLAQRARAAGLPWTTDADLCEAAFHDGVTSQERSDEISGRGVGLSAVRATIRSLGGEVELASGAGAGTRIVVRVPFPTDATAAQDEAAAA